MMNNRSGHTPSSRQPVRKALSPLMAYTNREGQSFNVRYNHDPKTGVTHSLEIHGPQGLTHHFTGNKWYSDKPHELHSDLVQGLTESIGRKESGGGPRNISPDTGREFGFRRPPRQLLKVAGPLSARPRRMARRGPVVRKSVHPLSGKIVLHPQDDIPGILTWAKEHLLPHELRTAAQGMRGVAPQLNGLTSISSLGATTLAGRAVRDWYKEKEGMLKVFAGHDPDPRDFYRWVGQATAFSGNGAFAKAELAARLAQRVWKSGAVVNGVMVPGRSSDPRQVKALLMAYFRPETGEARYHKTHPFLAGEAMTRRRAGADAGIDINTAGQTKWQGLGGAVYEGGHLNHAVEMLTRPETLMRDIAHIFSTRHPVKYNSYAHNQMGHHNLITVDTHDQRLKGIANLTPAMYHIGQAITRHLASVLNQPEFNPMADHPTYGQDWVGSSAQAAGWGAKLAAGVLAAQNPRLPPEGLARMLTGQNVYDAANPTQLLVNSPTYRAVVQDQIAEGSERPDVFEAMEANRKRFEPPEAELKAHVGGSPYELAPVMALGKEDALASKARAAVARRRATKPAPLLPGFGEPSL